MRVAPEADLHLDALDPKVVPHPSQPPAQGGFPSLTAGSEGEGFSCCTPVPVPWIDQEVLNASIAVSCAVSMLGIASAAMQHFSGNVTGGIGVAALSCGCLLLSLASISLQGCLRHDAIRRMLTLQAIIMNAALLALSAFNTDGFERRRHMSWHSFSFKLMAVAGSSLPRCVAYLWVSFCLDCCVHIWTAVEFGGDVDVQELAFLLWTSATMAVLCASSSRRSQRLKDVGDGVARLHSTLEFVLHQAWDCWLFLDARHTITRCHGELFSPLQEEPADKQHISMYIDDNIESERALEKALRSLRSEKQVAWANVTLAGPKGAQRKVEMAVLKVPGAQGSMGSKSASYNCCGCVCRFSCRAGKGIPTLTKELPQFIVGIRMVKDTPEPEPAEEGRGVWSSDSNAASAHAAQQAQGQGVAPRVAASRTHNPPLPSGRQQEEDDDAHGESNEASVLPEALRPAAPQVSARSHSSGSRASGPGKSSQLFDVNVIRSDATGTLNFNELHALGRKEHWIVDPEHLCMEESTVLGSGTFGTVTMGSFYGAPVAIKVPKTDKKETLPLMNELRTLRRLRHPNIVLFIGAHVVPRSSDMALIFELIEGATLQDWIDQHQKPIVCDSGKIQVLRGISLALRYLHQQDKSLVHGDLKSCNVFVESALGMPKAKLGDFGLSRFLYKMSHTMGGSLRWMAPEIVTGTNRSPSSAADIFPLGALMSFTLTGIKPCDGLDRQQIIWRVQKNALPPLNWPDRSELSAQIEELGIWCYAMDPFRRPNIMEVLFILDMCKALCEESHSAMKDHSRDQVLW